MTAQDLPYTTRLTCRVCNSNDLIPLFSLGNQHVSDFVTEDRIQAGVSCPIDLELCQSCTAVQAKHTAPQELLYTRHYWYRSGTTDTMRRALRDVTETAERIVQLQPDNVVLDLGANDGSLLRSYGKPCFRVGVEPADNLQAEGGQGLDVLIHDFWGTGDGLEAYHRRVGVKAKVVTAAGMLYDLEDPGRFVADVAQVLHRDGVFIAQLMCAKGMLDVNDVGNLTHEHLIFFSLRSLRYLFAVHGLDLFDVEVNNVNGRSYRLYARHQGSRVGQWSTKRSQTSSGHWTQQLLRRAARSIGLARDTPNAGDSRLAEAFAAEEGLDRAETFQRWHYGLEFNRNRCVAFIRKQVAAGKKVWVYGASTKGNVILQFYGLDSSLITAAADRSPQKWGRFTVGTGIPIVSEEEFRRARPDFALVLPYAFRAEFLERERDWLAAGGRFVFPLPAFEVVP